MRYRINQTYFEKRSLRITKEISKLQNIQNHSDKNNTLEFGSIIVEKTLNLTLLEYWNLQDSLKFSEYTIPKLKSWHETGAKRLNHLIAKLGIPLHEARTQFKYLNPKYKFSLKEKFSKIGERFEMDEILISNY